MRSCSYALNEKYNIYKQWSIRKTSSLGQHVRQLKIDECYPDIRHVFQMLLGADKGEQKHRWLNKIASKKSVTPNEIYLQRPIYPHAWPQLYFDGPHVFQFNVNYTWENKNVPIVISVFQHHTSYTWCGAMVNRFEKSMLQGSFWVCAHQWGTALYCNVVSHWLSSHPEGSLWWRGAAHFDVLFGQQLRLKFSYFTSGNVIRPCNTVEKTQVHISIYVQCPWCQYALMATSLSLPNN